MKKKKREYYLSVDDIWEHGENKYEMISKIAQEVRRLFEIAGERKSELIIKAIENFREGKLDDEKDSSGGNG